MDAEILRLKSEDRVAAVLQKYVPSMRGKILGAIRDYGSVQAIPPQFWVDLSNEMDQKHAALLVILMLAAYSDTEDMLGIANMPEEDVILGASPLSVRIAQNNNRLWVASIRNRLIKASRDGEALAGDTVRDIVNDDGATLTARNSTVQTRAAGRRSAGGDYARRHNVQVRMIWRTHPELSRSGPCPECEALNGLPEFDDRYGGGGWAEEAPEGPPLHPNCVCDLEPVEY